MMNVNICGVEFKNPVIGASGTYGFGKAYSEYIDLNKLGGISTKGLRRQIGRASCRERV